MNRAFAFFFILACGLACFAQQGSPGVSAHLPSQAAAEIIRQAAGADGAFIAAGNLNPSYDPKNLASLMQLPTEKIAVLNLRGSEIKQAFQRSVALYPQTNTSFLQIAGFTVEFKGSGPPSGRVISIKAGEAPLDLQKTYKIAMPSGLAEGAMGYFKIWDKSKIVKTLDVTLEQALDGKPFAESSPHWVLR